LFNTAEVFGQVGEKLILDFIEELVLLPHLAGLLLVHLPGHVYESLINSLLQLFLSPLNLVDLGGSPAIL
jgi:hypothetical protein